MTKEIISEVYNMDCIAGMKEYPDKYFDLAIVDPPYGIGANKMTLGNGKRKIFRGNDDWDKEAPSIEYFLELFRVSKNQIIWGGNYFTENLYSSNCWVIWDKMQEFSGATFEMAWTSFKSPSKAFRMSSAVAYTRQNKIHPTQKPVALYRWLLENYAKPGDRILDTHGGSMSSAIACHDLGFDLDICELDPDYFKAGKERFERHVNRWAGLDSMIADTNDYSNLNTGLFAQQ